MAKRRYYSEDDFEFGVTPSQLKRLGRAKQLEYVLYWFWRNFEDPVHQTPHDSADGGYQYIWGGPYDAQEQLWDEFGDIVSEERLEEAVAEVERDGTVDWAPGPKHPDHQRGAEEWDAEEYPDIVPDLDEIVRGIEAGTQVRFGDPYELAQRKVVVERITTLQQALERLRPTRGGIGHNRPPPDNDVSAEKSTEIAEAANYISTELSKPEPDALAVGRSAQTLKGVLKWAAAKADMAFDEFLKKLAHVIALAAGLGLAGHWDEVLQAIQSVVNAAANWLSSITLPF